MSITFVHVRCVPFHSIITLILSLVFNTPPVHLHLCCSITFASVVFLSFLSFPISSVLAQTRCIVHRCRSVFVSCFLTAVLFSGFAVRIAVSISLRFNRKAAFSSFRCGCGRRAWLMTLMRVHGRFTTAARTSIRHTRENNGWQFVRVKRDRAREIESGS